MKLLVAALLVLSTPALAQQVSAPEVIAALQNHMSLILVQNDRLQSEISRLTAENAKLVAAAKVSPKAPDPAPAAPASPDAK